MSKPAVTLGERILDAILDVLGFALMIGAGFSFAFAMILMMGG